MLLYGTCLTETDFVYVLDLPKLKGFWDSFTAT